MIKYPAQLFFLSFILACLISCKKSSPLLPDKGKALVLSAVEQQKAVADNAFAINLFKAVNSTNTGGANIFISPLSASFALGMTINGASGATYDAMKNTLNFNGLTQDQVNSYYKNLITNLPQLDPNTTLNIANSVWYRNTFSVLPQFLNTNNTSFNANIQALDFNDPSSKNTINSWVSSQTKGKIPTIIDQVKPDDLMYLVNAIYFKSGWEQKFDVANTRSRPFYLGDNSQVEVSSMQGNIPVNYYIDDKVTIAELPYSNNRFSMLLVMPKTGTTLNALVAGLDSAEWKNWTTGMYAGSSLITMPKFSFSYSAPLKNELSDLGMAVAFSDAADFTRLSAGGNLKITDVKQRAFIDIDENGTTAAAVTSVTIGPTMVAVPPNLTFDHPFLFVIREVGSGLILFTGVVNNPLISEQ